jgi:hypothetical protein
MWCVGSARSLGWATREASSALSRAFGPRRFAGVRDAVVLAVVRTFGGAQPQTVGRRTPAPNRHASANQASALMPMRPFDDSVVYTGMPGPRKVRSVGGYVCTYLHGVSP